MAQTQSQIIIFSIYFFKNTKAGLCYKIRKLNLLDRLFMAKLISMILL